MGVLAGGSFPLWGGVSVSLRVHSRVGCTLCNPETRSQTADSPWVAALDSGVTDGQQLGPQPGSTAGLWGMGCAVNSSRGRDLLLVRPPRGVIGLERLRHSWEANVEDFLCAVCGGWGRPRLGGWGSWVAAGCGRVVGGGVIVLGV